MSSFGYDVASVPILSVLVLRFEHYLPFDLFMLAHVLFFTFFSLLKLLLRLEFDDGDIVDIFGMV